MFQNSLNMFTTKTGQSVLALKKALTNDGFSVNI
jgi:hypothetical protein